MNNTRNTHLIYRDKNNYVWMEAHGTDISHPVKADSMCEIPSQDDGRWIEGKPNKNNTQFLIISPFGSSGKLDVSIESQVEPKNIYANVNSFNSCVKYMPIEMLDFKPVPEYSANSIHTFGLFFHQAKEPFKIVELENDERKTLLDKVRDTLNPGISQTIRHIGSKENNTSSDIKRRFP